MPSLLFDTLIEERLAEAWAAVALQATVQRAVQAGQRLAQQVELAMQEAERQRVETARRVLTTALIARFPTLPLRVGQDLAQITDAVALEALLVTVITAPDEASAVAAIVAAAAPPAPLG